jgi:hypothetical protein
MTFGFSSTTNYSSFVGRKEGLRRSYRMAQEQECFLASGKSYLQLCKTFILAETKGVDWLGSKISLNVLLQSELDQRTQYHQDFILISHPYLLMC